MTHKEIETVLVKTYVTLGDDVRQLLSQIGRITFKDHELPLLLGIYDLDVSFYTKDLLIKDYGIGYISDIELRDDRAIVEMMIYNTPREQKIIQDMIARNQGGLKFYYAERGPCKFFEYVDLTLPIQLPDYDPSTYLTTQVSI